MEEMHVGCGMRGMGKRCEHGSQVLGLSQLVGQRAVHLLASFESCST